MRTALVALFLFLSFPLIAPSIGHLDNSSKPIINSVPPDRATLSEKVSVTIKGENFLPDSQVILGDGVATDINIISNTEIRFTVPPQEKTGGRILTVRTKNGLAQHIFGILPKPLAELAVGEITTVAGADITYFGDGSLATSKNVAVYPYGICIDKSGDLFIADFMNQVVRRVDGQSQIINTVAGSFQFGLFGSNGDNQAALIVNLANP